MRVFLLGLTLVLSNSLSAQDINSWTLDGKGCSYYPRNYGWDNMWDHFNTEIISRDFGELKELGCTYVRLFIRPLVCGIDAYKGNDFKKFRQNLDRLLSIAEETDLKIQFVLFDGIHFGFFDYPEKCKTWIDSVLFEPIAQHPKIIRWELTSEFNLIYENHPNKKNVLTWYNQLFPHLKNRKGKHQGATVSIGVFGTAYVQLQFLKAFTDTTYVKKENLPDTLGLVFSKYAYYFPAVHDTIISYFPEDRIPQIIITELGYDTFEKTELFQKDQFRNAFWYFREKNIRDVAIWTLWDFHPQVRIVELEEIKQHYFGLKRIDGTHKPSYQLIRDVFHDLPISYQISNSSFEEINGEIVNNNMATIPDGWHFWPWNDKAEHRVTFSDQEAFDGNYSLKIENTGEDTLGAFFEQGVPTKPGSCYKLSGYTKIIGISDAFSQLTISWHSSKIFPDENTYVTDSNSTPITTKDEWVKIEVIAKAPDSHINSMAIMAKPYCKTRNGSAQTYFDSLKFELVPEIQCAATSRSQSPDGLILNHAFPNPFNSETKIAFSLPKPTSIKLSIFDGLGRKVKTIVDGYQEAGFHVANWNGTDEQGNQVATGVYFIKMQSDKSSKIRKIAYLK